MTFKIATWNINSVRLRIELVKRFLSEQQPDVLCLQETKCPDGQFPAHEFVKAGYKHQVINGQKGYHGVANVARHGLTEETRRGFCGKGDSRHVSAIVDFNGKGLAVHNLYVPAGGDEPDPGINDKFAHKLAFVDELAQWFTNDGPGKERAVLVGDLNIAPLEHDVWSHKALLSVVSHTPIEVEKFVAARKAGGWHDALRHFVPDEEKLYTWWSYRSPDWNAANKGRRLDHVWVSSDLKPQLKAMKVHRDARGWERPSDHVPVVVEMAL